MSDSADHLNANGKEFQTDAGDSTARNYRYQHSYGAILLAAAASGKRPYVAIWYEHHEDFLAERTDDRWDLYQVKTRQPEKGPWTMASPELVHSIKRFTSHELRSGDRGDYYFVSNVALKTASSTSTSAAAARSPERFLEQVMSRAGSGDLPPPYCAIFDKLLAACNCSSEILYAVLRRLHFVRGPSREDMASSLAQDHLSALPEFANLTAIDIGRARDDLVGAVYRASSLQVTDSLRHLQDVLSRKEPHPTLHAKRMTTNILQEIALRFSPQSSPDQLGDLNEKVSRMLLQMEGLNAGGLLNREQIRALLTAFAEEEVGDGDIFPLLLEKARELDELKQRLSEREGARPDDEALQNLHSALDRGDYAAADARLEQLIHSDVAGSKRELHEILDFIRMRASLADARLRYSEAARHFETAAGFARIFDAEMAYELSLEHAAALLRDAIAKGSAKRFRLALDASERLLNKSEPGTDRYYYAVSDYVRALALYAERAPPAQSRSAIEATRLLAEPLVANMDVDEHLDVWITLASTLGNALSSLSHDALAAEQRPGAPVHMLVTRDLVLAPWRRSGGN